MQTSKTYLVEEFYRGDWQPLMVRGKDGKKTQKKVTTLPQYAEVLNGDSKETKLRYVPEEEEVKFNYKTASKADLIAFCNDNEIEVLEDDTAKVLKEKIEQFLNK